MLSLAERIARRFMADAIVDPKEALAKFRVRVDVFCQREEFAKQQIPIFKEFAEALQQAAQDPRQGDEKYEKSRALSNSLDPGARDRGSIKWDMQGGWWFREAKNIARPLFWALIQLYALPPQLQRSIESASKFWSKERKNFRPKNTVSPDIEILTAYLKLCAELQDQVANVEAAIVKGVLHSDPAQAAKTRFPVGKFTVVNTGGFNDETMRRSVEVVSQAEKAMTNAGLGKACYGDALISKHIRAKKTIVAFYLPSSDEFFVRADVPEGSDTVRHVCHELAHRLEHKFLSNKRSAMISLYNHLKGEDEEREEVPYDAYPRVGEEYTTTGPWAARDPGKKVRVKGVSYRKKTVQYFVLDKDGATGNSYFEVPIQAWWVQFRGQNLEVPKKPLVLGRFVTGYAKSGGPFENFAEMVSFYALGKLPELQIKPLEDILFL